MTFVYHQSFKRIAHIKSFTQSNRRLLNSIN